MSKEDISYLERQAMIANNDKLKLLKLYYTSMYNLKTKVMDENLYIKKLKEIIGEN